MRSSPDRHRMLRTFGSTFGRRWGQFWGKRDRYRPRHARTAEPLTPTQSGFRPDIEGLRAVAVLAVLLYHAGIPLVAGGYIGVDVFFVISGFLITGLLVRELDKTGRISLLTFYARRVRRLLPAAVVVLLVVTALSWQLLSPVHRVDVAGDIAAAGLYVVNWRLAIQAVDYFADEGLANPVQHFWSLAVEEQFYFIWPALLLGVALLWWRRRGARHKPVLLATILTVGGLSFAYSLYASYFGTADSYFSTLTRGWELALGGALALLVTRLPALPAWAVRLLGIGGLAAIGWSAVALSDATAFPGFAALLPTLGAVALIVAGAYDAGWTQRVLTWGPVRHIGKISYSWYLWHWPVIVFAGQILGGLTPAQGVVAAALSYIPAVLSYKFVEEPFRRAQGFELRPVCSWRLAIGCTGTAVAAAMALQLTIPSSASLQADDVEGAEIVRESTELQASAEVVVPDPLEARDDMPQINDDGCQVEADETELRECVYGNEDSKTSVVAFGDSHMMQYGPALEILAEDHDWRLQAHIKAGCSPSDVTMYNHSLKREYGECDEWREAAVQSIVAEDPDMIILTGRSTTPATRDGEPLEQAEGEPILEQGWVDTLSRLQEETDAEIVVIRDNPQMGEDGPDCVSRSLPELKDCAMPAEDALDFEPVEANAAEQVEETHVVDLTPVLCPDDICPAVIGDVIVYRDTNHLTATFVETMTGWIDEQLPVLEEPST